MTNTHYKIAKIVARQNELRTAIDEIVNDIEVIRKEVRAWQETRNNRDAKVNWQFTTKDARIKLSRLYPTLND